MIELSKKAGNTWALEKVTYKHECSILLSTRLAPACSTQIPPDVILTTRGLRSPCNHLFSAKFADLSLHEMFRLTVLCVLQEYARRDKAEQHILHSCDVVLSEERVSLETPPPLFPPPCLLLSLSPSALHLSSLLYSVLLCVMQRRVKKR